MTAERYLYPHMDALALFEAMREAVGQEATAGSPEQMEAAHAEASSALGALASLTGSAVRPAAITGAQRGTERRLLRRLLEAPLGLALGDIRGCRHVEEGRGPIAVLATAWSRRVVCLSRRCLERHLEELRPREADCSRCGAPVPPPGLQMVVAQLGHTILAARLCPACMEDAGRELMGE